MLSTVAGIPNILSPGTMTCNLPSLASPATATSVPLGNVRGLVATPDGRGLLIADYSNGKIWNLTSGILAATAYTGFSKPGQIVSDNAGGYILADFGGNCVKKVRRVRIQHTPLAAR